MRLMFIRYRPCFAKQSGFSFIELVIVMTIIGVISLFSVNLPNHFIASINTRVSTQSISHMLRSSRSQAINLLTEVIVCPSKDEIHCHNDWNSNLISFIDSNKNNRRDNSEPINLRHYNSTDLTVSYSRSIRLIKFNPDGRVNSNGSFFICSNQSNVKKQALVINRQGRVRLAKDNDGDGIVEGANANNINC